MKALCLYLRTKTFKVLPILMVVSFCVHVNAYGQLVEQERALEYKKLNEVFSSAFSVAKVNDSTANYVFAVSLSMDQSVPKLESNSPMFNVFFPNIEPVLLKKIDFHKIAPNAQIKQIIIPFMVMIIGKKNGKTNMISEAEALQVIDTLFYKNEKSFEWQTLIMFPHKIAADLGIYH